MWPRRFFAGRYFAPRYFVGGAAAPSGTHPPLTVTGLSLATLGRGGALSGIGLATQGRVVPVVVRVVPPLRTRARRISRWSSERRGMSSSRRVERWSSKRL